MHRTPRTVPGKQQHRRRECGREQPPTRLHPRQMVSAKVFASRPSVRNLGGRCKQCVGSRSERCDPEVERHDVDETNIGHVPDPLRRLGSGLPKCLGGRGGGTILKWNGKDWSAQSSGTPDPLYGIWGTDVKNIFAVGGPDDRGSSFKWNGTVWQTEAPIDGLSTFHGVWGAGATNVWIIGRLGGILHQSGTSWKKEVSGLPLDKLVDLYAVWGTDASNVWAVGAQGAILRWYEAKWNLFMPPMNTYADLLAVWGTSEDNVLAVGRGGKLGRFEGVVWKTEASGTSETLHAIWGTDASNVWVVGDFGTILHYPTP